MLESIQGGKALNDNLERELKRQSGVERITSLKDVKKIERGKESLRTKHFLVFNDVYRGLSKASYTLKPTIGVFAEQNRLGHQGINQLDYLERVISRFIRLTMNTKGIEFIQNTESAIRTRQEYLSRLAEYFEIKEQLEYITGQ